MKSLQLKVTASGELSLTALCPKIVPENGTAWDIQKDKKFQLLIDNIPEDVSPAFVVKTMRSVPAWKWFRFDWQEIVKNPHKIWMPKPSA